MSAALMHVWGCMQRSGYRWNLLKFRAEAGFEGNLAFEMTMLTCILA